MNKSVFVAAPLALALTACQGVPGTDWTERQVEDVLEAMRVTVDEEVDNISNFRLNGWNRVNDRNLVVTAGVHDHYLLQLVEPCFGLEYAFRIAVQSRGINLTRFDDVIVNGLHDGPERCRIDRIYKLEDMPDAEI